MALDTNSTLATLKLEALSSIMDSMVINYPEMKNRLSTLTQTSSSFQSLLTIYSPTFQKLTSQDINGSMLLAYLDFYTLYILLYANLAPINNLINITKNKLSYLESIYKDTDSILLEKGYQKQNKYVFYTNFLNPKNIDLSISKVYLSKDKLSDSLNISPALTLPIEKTHDVNVISISSKDTDSYVNVIENNNNKNNIDYYVNRKGFNKIGVVSSVTPLKENNTYSEMPKISGTIHGYFSENISIVVTGVQFDNSNRPSVVSIKGSSDNIVWSTPTDINVNISSSIFIDSQIDVGLSITFNSAVSIAVGDSWKINLRYISIENPTLISAIKFMSLEKISFITWDDLTKDSTNFISHRVKYRRAERFQDFSSNVFTNGINNITPVFNNINDYELTVEQNSYYPKQVGANLAHSFNYKLSNIKGIYNEYKSYGIISFGELPIKKESPVLNLNIQANQFITNDYVYPVTNGVTTIDLKKQSIEYSLMVTFDKDKIFIPCLNADETSVDEYIVPTVSTEGLATYLTRFPVDETYNILVSNISTGEILTKDDGYQIAPAPINPEDNPGGNRKFLITINNYDVKSIYVASYTPLVNSYLEATNYVTISGGWIFNNRVNDSNIYYMYFRDMNGKNKIAICTIGDLIPADPAHPDDPQGRALTAFYGSVSGIVEMRSLDQGYISPVVFEYTLLAN